MAFLGKEFKLTSQENFEALFDALGPIVPADAKANLVKSKPTTVITKDGDTYTIVTKSPEYNRESKFKSGVEYEENVMNKMPCKTTYTVNGNVIDQLMKFENGGTFSVKRTFTDDTMEMEITTSAASGIVAKRIYKA